LTLSVQTHEFHESLRDITCTHARTQFVITPPILDVTVG